VPRGYTQITDFTAGELSPRWLARVEGGVSDPLQGAVSISSMYRSGCIDITNFVVLPQGGVARRIGFVFGRDLSQDLEAGVIAENMRLFRYEYRTSDFLVVVAPGKLYVYPTDTLTPFGGMGAYIYTADTPYSLDDVRNLHVTQYQNYLVLFADYWRPRLLKLAAETWSFTDALEEDFTPPLYDFKDSRSPPTAAREYDVTFTLAQDRYVNVSVSGNASVKKPEYILVRKADINATLLNIVNALKLNKSIIPSSVNVVYTGSGGSLEYTIEYEFLASAGDGTGILNLDILDPASSDSITLTLVSAGASGGEPLWSGPAVLLKSSTWYQCIVPHFAASANEPGVGGSWTTYWTSLGSSLPTNVDYTDITGTGWAIDTAYGPYDRRWPHCGAAHEQRLIANGPHEARGVIAGSRTGVARFLDFTAGTNDDDGFVFLLVVTGGATINWLHAQRLLFVGSSVGIFVQTEIPITPTQVQFSRQGSYTLSEYDGFDVAGETFYIQRNGRQVRQVQYVRELDSWQSRDMTAYAEHLFTDTQPLVDHAYQNAPDSLLWMLRSDGGLLSFTYEKFYSVAAWAKHATRGTVRALEAFKGGSVDDYLALIIERTVYVNGVPEQRPFLEFLPETSCNEWVAMPNTATGDWTYANREEQTWHAYVDSFQELSGNGQTTLVVASRFNEQVVTIVENGVVLGDFSVSAAGVVSLPQATVSGSRIFVGYNYVARLRPTRIEPTSGAQAQKIRWAQPMLRLFAAAMPKVNGKRPDERTQDTPYDTATTLFTGDVSIALAGVDNDLVIEADRPLPCQISGIFGLVSVEGS
jgi:hypothetical protein